ncbi:unnamed protein product [Vitrella brassicaformis CCMP3155]|uniref:TLDc domain-containing protein n=3 Tax=Vitrella brassicaformis TaxID=1169539 RepID=A0A0G4ELR7_VITBC|nr:unnamed protein product [Vitrella brassicaformis CCMP3155]|eukprot:CEL97964.1 unnamed protein product [Vitrella brassicaformis CCMP3155]
MKMAYSIDLDPDEREEIKSTDAKKLDGQWLIRPGTPNAPWSVKISVKRTGESTGSASAEKLNILLARDDYFFWATKKPADSPKRNTDKAGILGFPGKQGCFGSHGHGGDKSQGPWSFDDLLTISGQKDSRSHVGMQLRGNMPYRAITKGRDSHVPFRLVLVEMADDDRMTVLDETDPFYFVQLREQRGDVRGGKDDESLRKKLRPSSEAPSLIGKTIEPSQVRDLPGDDPSAKAIFSDPSAPTAAAAAAIRAPTHPPTNPHNTDAMGARFRSRSNPFAHVAPWAMRPSFPPPPLPPPTQAADRAPLPPPPHTYANGLPNGSDSLPRESEPMRSPPPLLHNGRRDSDLDSDGLRMSSSGPSIKGKWAMAQGTTGGSGSLKGVSSIPLQEQPPLAGAAAGAAARHKAPPPLTAPLYGQPCDTYQQQQPQGFLSAHPYGPPVYAPRTQYFGGCGTVPLQMGGMVFPPPPVADGHGAAAVGVGSESDDMANGDSLPRESLLCNGRDSDCEEEGIARRSGDSGSLRGVSSISSQDQPSPAAAAASTAPPALPLQYQAAHPPVPPSATPMYGHPYDAQTNNMHQQQQQQQLQQQQQQQPQSYPPPPFGLPVYAYGAPEMGGPAAHLAPPMTVADSNGAGAGATEQRFHEIVSQPVESYLRIDDIPPDAQIPEFYDGISFSLGEAGRELLRYYIRASGHGKKGKTLQNPSIPVLLRMAYETGLWRVAVRLHLEHKGVAPMTPAHEEMRKYKQDQSRRRREKHKAEPKGDAPMTPSNEEMRPSHEEMRKYKEKQARRRRERRMTTQPRGLSVPCPPRATPFSQHGAAPHVAGSREASIPPRPMHPPRPPTCAAAATRHPLWARPMPSFHPQAATHATQPSPRHPSMAYPPTAIQPPRHASPGGSVHLHPRSCQRIDGSRLTDRHEIQSPSHNGPSHVSRLYSPFPPRHHPTAYWQNSPLQPQGDGYLSMGTSVQRGHHVTSPAPHHQPAAGTFPPPSFYPQDCDRGERGEECDERVRAELDNPNGEHLFRQSAPASLQAVLQRHPYGDGGAANGWGYMSPTNGYAPVPQAVPPYQQPANSPGLHPTAAPQCTCPVNGNVGVGPWQYGSPQLQSQQPPYLPLAPQAAAGAHQPPDDGLPPPPAAGAAHDGNEENGLQDAPPLVSIDRMIGPMPSSQDNEANNLYDPFGSNRYSPSRSLFGESPHVPASCAAAAIGFQSPLDILDDFTSDDMRAHQGSPQDTSCRPSCSVSGEIPSAAAAAPCGAQPALESLMEPIDEGLGDDMEAGQPMITRPAGAAGRAADQQSEQHSQSVDTMEHQHPLDTRTESGERRKQIPRRNDDPHFLKSAPSVVSSRSAAKPVRSVTADDLLSDVPEVDGDVIDVSDGEAGDVSVLSTRTTTDEGEDNTQLIAGSSLTESQSAKLHSMLVPSTFKECTFTLLYRGSVHGWQYGDLMRHVGGASSIVFIIRKDCCVSGIYIDGGLTLPKAGSFHSYSCEMTHFSLIGPFDKPTMIYGCRPDQRVSVAGLEKLVCDEEDGQGGRSKLKLGIWQLGYSDFKQRRQWSSYIPHVGPSADLRRCHRAVVPGQGETIIADELEVLRADGHSWRPPFEVPKGSGLSIQEAVALSSVLPRSWQNRKLKLLCRASAGWHRFSDLVRCVGDASPLVFLVMKGPAVLGATMSLGIKLPDGTAMEKEYYCAVKLFFLSGHFGDDRPRTIPVPSWDCPDRVRVLAPEGAVDGRGKLELASPYSGALSLAYGCDDVRQCHQVIPKRDVPDGYQGRRNEDGRALPGGSAIFMADDVLCLTLE